MSSYIEQLADRIVDVCAVPGMAPLERDLALIYAVLALAKGRTTTLEDVHDAWAARCAMRERDHPCAVPFRSLTAAQQALDRPFLDAIHAAAAWRVSPFDEADSA